MKPGDFNDGPVTLDTVKAVNNILKPNVLPYLMVLSTREDTRGTTLNENFHRFIGTELGMGYSKIKFVCVGGDNVFVFHQNITGPRYNARLKLFPGVKYFEILYIILFKCRVNQI